MHKLSILASAVVLALGTTSCTESKTPEQYLLHANQLIAAGDNTTAIVELKNAIVQSPQNGELRYTLGKAYIEEGSYVNAEKELEKAARLGVTGLNSELGFVKLKLQKSEEVYQILEQSGDLADSEYVLLLIYSGISAMYEGKLSEGQDYFSQAAALNAEAIYGRMAKAYLAQSTLSFGEALTIVDSLLDENPELSEAILLKGNLQFAMEDYVQAAETFQNYLERHQKAFQVQYFRVNSYIKAKDFEKADELLSDLMQLVKEAPLAYQFKAQIEYQKQNYSEAKRYGEMASQYGDEFFIAKMLAGASAYMLGELEQAYAHLRPLESLVDKNHPIKRMLTAVKLKLGYADEAVDGLSGFQTDDTEFLQLSGIELLRAGKLDESISLFERAEQNSPESATLKAQKGLLLLSKNNQTGVASLEDAIELDPTLENVEISLALEYLNNNEFDKVQSIIDKKLASVDEKATGLLLQGLLFTKQENRGGAEESFKQALIIEPNNIAVLFNLATLAEYSDDEPIAVEYYEKVLTLSPNHSRALYRYSDLLSSRTDDAVVFLEGLLDRDKLQETLSFILATLYVKQGNGQIAKALLEDLISQTPEAGAYNYVTYSDSFSSENDYTSALSIIDKGLSIYPADYTLIVRKIGLLELMHNYSDAITHIRLGLDLYPSDLRLSILLPQMHVSNKEYDLARGELAKLRKNQVTHHLVDSMSGLIALLDKDYALATENYHLAYEKKPNQSNLLGLARALRFSGNTDETIQLFESYLEDNSENNTVRALLAQLYVDTSLTKAISHYQQLVKRKPDNLVFLNNLAWYQYKQGNVNNALPHIEHAITLSPNNAALLDTYGVILLTSSKKLEAKKYLQRAIDNGSTSEKTVVLLAQAYVDDGDNQAAIKVLNIISEPVGEFAEQYRRLKSIAKK